MSIAIRICYVNTLNWVLKREDSDEVGTFSVTVYDPVPPAGETDAVMFYVVEEVWRVFLPVVGR